MPSPVGRVLYHGLETDLEKLPAGHYTGRGNWQERTGPSGPFLVPEPPTVVRPGPPPRGSGEGKGPRNYRRSDQRLYEEVCEALTEDGDVDASQIEVSVEDGIVTLTGSVARRAERHWAEEIAAIVPGVVDVENRIRAPRRFTA